MNGSIRLIEEFGEKFHEDDVVGIRDRLLSVIWSGAWMMNGTGLTLHGVDLPEGEVAGLFLRWFLEGYVENFRKNSVAIDRAHL
jgi:hypothetical protein